MRLELARINKNTVLIIVFLLSIFTWLLGIFIGFFVKFSLPSLTLNLSPAFDLILLTLGVFIFSLLFFGSSAPFLLFLIGLSQGHLFKMNPSVVVLNSVPLFIAAYSAIITGSYLFGDFKGRGNLFEHKKEIFLPLIISLIAALLIGLVVA